MFIPRLTQKRPPHCGRRLRVERLEPRFALAGDAVSLDDSVVDQVEAAAEDLVADDFASGDLTSDDSTPPPYIAARHNPVNPADVDLSGELTPLDALLVINHLH